MSIPAWTPPPDGLVVASCIACGRLDGAGVCTGDCADRPLALVTAAALGEIRDALAGAREAAEAVRQLVAMLHSDMEPSDPERTYRQLQPLARAALRALPAEAPAPPSRVDAWRCATCGRIESPQPCLGVCVKHDLAVVPATEHDALRDELAILLEELRPARPLLVQLGWSTPRAGGWAASLAALRDRTGCR
jgi:hypothetical protein